MKSFKYVIDASAEEPIMLLNGGIGLDENGDGIDGALFQSELMRLDAMGKKLIKIYINSPGGLVTDGMAIYHAITRSKSKVDTYNCGLAASIAAVIFQAGRKRISSDYSILMFHAPYVPGKETDAADPFLNAMGDAINTMISRSGMSKEAIEEMMKQGDTFLTPDEALALKLTDEIECSSDFNKKRMSAVSGDAVASYKLANVILNSVLTHKINNMSFLKVTSKLQLNADASEESVLNAIVALEAKYDAAEVLNKKSADELKKMKDDMDEAEDKFKKLSDEFKKATDELTAAKDAAILEKASNLINGFVKAGKIKAEASEKWVNLAKVDFEGTKTMIDELPVNAKASSLSATPKSEVKVPAAMNAEARMLAIAAKHKQR